MALMAAKMTEYVMSLNCCTMSHTTSLATLTQYSTKFFFAAAALYLLARVHISLYHHIQILKTSSRNIIVTIFSTGATRWMQLGRKLTMHATAVVYVYLCKAINVTSWVLACADRRTLKCITRGLTLFVL